MKPYSFLIILCSLMSTAGQAQEIWTIGPMLHFNFGGEKRSTSFAIEVAYWNVSHFPHSVDAAIEFDRGKIRFYSELQTGIGVAGLSLGPVLEINKKESSVHVGLQSTLWVNYFIGADFRMRWIDGTRYKCVGIYGKLPVATTGLDDDDENSYGDWDWD